MTVLSTIVMCVVCKEYPTSLTVSGEATINGCLRKKDTKVDSVVRAIGDDRFRVDATSNLFDAKHSPDFNSHYITSTSALLLSTVSRTGRLVAQSTANIEKNKERIITEKGNYRIQSRKPSHTYNPPSCPQRKQLSRSYRNGTSLFSNVTKSC